MHVHQTIELHNLCSKNSSYFCFVSALILLCTFKIVYYYYYYLKQICT